jgi:hypothetical protein
MRHRRDAKSQRFFPRVLWPFMHVVGEKLEVGASKRFRPRWLGLGTALALVGCRAPPWNLRPEAPSPIDSFFGAPDEFRLCQKADATELVAASVTTELGDTPGIIDRRVKPPHCAVFQPPAGALAAPATVTLETRRDADTPPRTERLPLTAHGVAWVPHTPIDVATRALFVAPLSQDNPDLVEFHTALRYRLSAALRAGAGLEVRFGPHAELFGTNAVVSSSWPVAARWVTHLDAEYLVGYTPHGLDRDGGGWVHGPSAVLALGYTGQRFLGAPSIADGGSIGPVVSVEYLFTPTQGAAIWLLGGGFFVHYGL